MKILTGYLQPDGGTAMIAGVDVTKDPLATKSRIGYLPESNPLYYDMYVREYLQFMAEVHGIADKKGRINTVINQVGLTPESHKKIGQLSKGYKQRVGLAAALIHDPEVLILDEPTTGLDPNQIIEIREVIRSLGAQKTILFSTHILQEVEAVCSRVIIINKGNLIADNNLKDLQASHSKPVIRVQFKEALEAQWLERAVTSLKELQKINAFEWQLEAADPVEAKKQLLALSVEQNLNIVSLQSSDQSLEDVFRSLTNS
jgi:ABC-2 type transport system ATP-binding protein